MKKKALATLLASAMVAGSLVGCGSSDTAAESTTEETTEAATEETAAEEATAEDTAEEAATDAADPVANLIAATTDTVTLTVWASEEDQDLTTKLLDEFKAAYPDAFDKNVHTPPMGHFGDAETEIGRVCVQLASADFKYISGETITLEGGLGQRP